MSDNDSQLPKTIGRYIIDREIGRGGMGVVYEGHDPDSCQRVAIKTQLARLLREEEDSAEFKERFLREARAPQRLDHPNIVKIYEVGEDNGLLYIAMEFVVGGDLGDYFASNKRIPIITAVELCATLCDALNEVHENKIIHRDLKPPNILMDGDVPKIGDFGLAHLTGQTITGSGVFLGSPPYMSPEQWRAENKDARTDLWAMGVIAYEILTEKRPFGSGDHIEMLYAIRDKTPTYPHQLNEYINLTLSAVIMKALSKNPDQRYQTGAKMAAALRESLKENPDPNITLVAPGSTLIAEQAKPTKPPTTVDLRRAAGSPPPRQLPAPLADFFGRKDKKDELEAALRTGASCVIHGMGGVGKSSLAVEVGTKLDDLFPDGQVYIEMRGVSEKPKATEDAMRDIVLAFNPSMSLPHSFEELRPFYNHTLRTRRALLFLDNAYDGAQIQPLLPPSPAVALITARRNIVLSGLRPIPLEEMPEPEATELLRTIMGSGGATEDQFRAIAKLCAGLPLALRAAGTFLVTHEDWMVEEFLTELADSRNRLERLHLVHENVDVEATLALSIRQLHKEAPETAAAWQMLTIFPRPFEREVATTVLDLPDVTVREMLSDLVRRSLLVYDKSNSNYHFHDLLLLMAQTVYKYNDSDPPKDQASRLHESAYRFSALVLQAFAVMCTRFDAVGLKPLNLGKESIEKSWDWAIEFWRIDERARTLCKHYVEHISMMPATLLYWKGSVKRLSAAVQIFAEKPDLLVQVRALRALADAHSAFHNYAEAILQTEAALALLVEFPDEEDKMVELAAIGFAYRNTGLLQQALECHKQSLDISRRTNNPTIWALNARNLGAVYLELGEHAAALRWFKTVWNYFRKSGTARDKGVCLMDIGSVHEFTGEHRKALRYYLQAERFSREADDFVSVAGQSRRLAGIYAELRRPQSASEFLEAALTIYRELGISLEEARCMRDLGDIYEQMGRSDEAIAEWRAAVELLERVRHPEFERFQTSIANRLGVSGP